MQQVDTSKYPVQLYLKFIRKQDNRNNRSLNFASLSGKVLEDGSHHHSLRV